jgi:hypothetical protein
MRLGDYDERIDRMIEEADVRLRPMPDGFDVFNWVTGLGVMFGHVSRSAVDGEDWLECLAGLIVVARHAMEDHMHTTGQ